MCYGHRVETPKNKGGRPATGHSPTRSMRIGQVWDDAKTIAEKRGDSLNGVITRALEMYVELHKREFNDPQG